MREAPSLLSVTLLSTSINLAQAATAPDASQSIRNFEQVLLQLPLLGSAGGVTL